MSADLEEQIRHLGRAFERFIDDIDADEVMHRADLRSIVTVGVDDDAHRNVSRSNYDGDRSAARRVARATRPARLSRLMTLVAACVLVGLGVAGVVLVRQRPTEPPSSTTLPFTQEPAWYEALAPLLPAGYEHVAIQGSHLQYVQFQAFNPATSKSLHITVTRTPMSPDPSGSMTLAVAQDEPWTDAASVDHNISLPDGRQIGLYCTFRPMPETEPGCPDVNGDHTDPEMLRSFALSLATDLDPAELPPASDELDHVSIDEIRSAIGDISTPPESADLEAPHYAFSFVQHGDPITPNFFTVRTVTGFYPPLPPDTPRTSASAGEFRLTWQPSGGNSIWYVSDSPANGLDVADEILDRAVADQATRPSGSVEMAVTWYEADLTSVERVVTPPLVCRSLNDQRDCDALAGAHLEAYRTEAGQVDIYTEYGPYESNMWQMLVQTAQEVDLAERVVLAIADNPELAGIDVSPDVRVVVVGEAGVDTASIAASLATHEEIVTVPVVFGDAVPTPSDFPRDSVAARYYAGYLDTTGDTTCVGAIGVPWNQDESCVPVQPDTLTVTVASPSPTRTILIATLPLNTVTAVALADGEPSRELTIIDASETGHKLSFAVLDGFIPRQLIVYDANDDVITRTDIISTGGAPLGYLPDNPGE